MKAFSAIAQSGLAPKVLDTKTKELVALGISVAIRCDDCIAFHVRAALDQRAREEVLETLGTAIYLGAGPSVMYASHALAHGFNLRPPRLVRCPTKRGAFDAVAFRCG